MASIAPSSGFLAWGSLLRHARDQSRALRAAFQPMAESIYELGRTLHCPFHAGYAGWYGTDGYYQTFLPPLQHVLLLGPVMYLYLKLLLDPSYSLACLTSYIYPFHAIPHIHTGDVDCHIWVLDEVFFYADGRDRDLDLWYQIAGFVSMIFYFGLSLKQYLKYRAD